MLQVRQNCISTTAAAISCAACRLRLVPGEVTCLLGRNGVGKTTLLKCLMGLIPAKSGEGVRLAGGRPAD